MSKTKKFLLSDNFFAIMTTVLLIETIAWFALWISGSI